MLKINVAMPIDGIWVPGLCPVWPIRPKDMPCPETERTESMDRLQNPIEDPIDEMPCGGVDPPINDSMTPIDTGAETEPPDMELPDMDAGISV